MWIAWTLVSVCPVRFCLGLIPLKSMPQAECDVLPYNTRLPTLWTPFDGWILGCQRGSHSTTTWLHIKQDTHDKCQECQLWSKVGVHIMVKPIVVAFAAHSVSFCVLLRVFDAFCAAPGGLFLLHRVGHWWRTYLLLMQLFPWKFLLDRGPGLTLECTGPFAIRSCGTPPPAFVALWNKIAGLPWNLGSDNVIVEDMSNCWCL